MSVLDDGGPVFPNEMTSSSGVVSGSSGMTLLDYFAGQAMLTYDGSMTSTPDVLAEWAYAVARAMIAEKVRQTEAGKGMHQRLMDCVDFCDCLSDATLASLLEEGPSLQELLDKRRSI